MMTFTHHDPIPWICERCPFRMRNELQVLQHLPLVRQVREEWKKTTGILTVSGSFGGIIWQLSKPEGILQPQFAITHCTPSLLSIPVLKPDTWMSSLSQKSRISHWKPSHLACMMIDVESEAILSLTEDGLKIPIERRRSINDFLPLAHDAAF